VSGLRCLPGPAGVALEMLGVAAWERPSGGGGRRRGAVELCWAGKGEASARSAASLRVVERFGERPAADDGSGMVADPPWRNQLVYGDNLAAMVILQDQYAGRIQLIYADPPFATGSTFVRRSVLGRGDVGGRSVLTAPAFEDAWGAGRAHYLEMLYERLKLMHSLLAEGGALYVHLDSTVVHYVKVLLDELFGCDGFQREIIWRIGWISGYKSRVANWVRNHDTILYYAKGRPGVFNRQFVPHRDGYARWSGGRTPAPGYPMEDVWNANAHERALTGSDSLDSIQIKSFSTEKTGFPTQKNESLLRRIVQASSNEGDLVADFFAGSGTTLVVADRLGRRWLGCDASPSALQTARRRLLGLNGVGPFEVSQVVKEGSGACPAPAGPHASRAGSRPRVQAELHLNSSALTVRLRDYQPRGTVAALGRHRGGSSGWTEHVDYWAVDYEPRGGVFHHDWWSARSGDALELLTSAPAPGRPGGQPLQVAVRVVDIYGDETTVLLGAHQ
jgi:hypothetical protein